MKAAQPILDSLAVSIGAPITLLTDAPTSVGDAVIDALQTGDGNTVEVEVAGQRYLACRVSHHTMVLVLGPYRFVSDPASSAATLDPDQVDGASRALGLAVAGLVDVDRTERERLELESQLEVTGRSVLAVTRELDLNTVLRRIVDLAREVVGARYAALGVPDDSGELATFVTSGMTPEQERRIGNLPRGQGILGLLLREPRTLRLKDLTTHPESSGFPEHHPPMKSFLGVPIVSRDRVLGNLYLTEKRIGGEFSDEDARRVELLSGHAAVAIENANLYRALEDQQQRLRTILERSPEAVLMAETDPERITVANHEVSHLLGWKIQPPVPLDEFLARNVRTTVTGEPVEMDSVPLVRSLRHGEEVTRAELRIERPDGSKVTALVNSSPIWDYQGRAIGAVVVFQDITRIKDAEQLKDDFISLVSHEMRTPLATIQAGAKMLSRDWDKIDPTDRRDLLDDISVEGSRLARLIENTVQLANIRAGRVAIETEPVQLASVINDEIASLQETAPGRQFIPRLEKNLVVDANSDRLGQVIQNLLHNAVKYSSADTPIEIDAESANDLVMVSIRDYGVGIAQEDIATLFEPFHRTNSAITSGVPGTGLGLYLSRQLIEAHGGDIWIELPDDGGTRVRFTVPLILLTD